MPSKLITIVCGCKFHIDIEGPDFKIDVKQCPTHANAPEGVALLRRLSRTGRSKLSSNDRELLDRFLARMDGVG